MSACGEGVYRVALAILSNLSRAQPWKPRLSLLCRSGSHIFVPVVDAHVHTVGKVFEFTLLCDMHAAIRAESLRWSIRLFLTHWCTH